MRMEEDKNIPNQGVIELFAQDLLVDAYYQPQMAKCNVSAIYSTDDTVSVND